MTTNHDSLRDEVRRIMPILERLEDSPLWHELSAGTGVATLNGLREAIAASKPEPQPIAGYANPIEWSGRESERVVKVTRRPQPQYGYTEPVVASKPEPQETPEQAYERGFENGKKWQEKHGKPEPQHCEAGPEYCPRCGVEDGGTSCGLPECGLIVGAEEDKPQEFQPCKGLNCGCTDGVSHSLECQAEHAAAIAGGVFVKPEQQAQAGEPVAVSNAFGCDKEAAGGTLCADWCGGPQCPTSNTSPEVDSSTEAYKAYADNLPGAHDHLTDGARKRLEEAANFCLSPRPNFEPKRNRGSDDGYYEHAEASRLWWAFAAGMNYEEKRTREAITKKDAALNACVEALESAKVWHSVKLHKAFVKPQCEAAITQAQECRK